MATEMAKAYVQVMPSARGITGSLSRVLSPEAGAAGQAAGMSIAGGIKGMLLTAGIGTALKKTITEGAALEQSIGGIETLFGAGGRSVEEYAEKVGKSVKDVQSEYNTLMASQEMVLANAANAYRTAGMSANEYMELTTSFAASLLQGLDGDTMAAAQIADMAMTDMSDNANKMGTDMARITDAYQGFAKQNYTMLDNLKLGYGGTKTEMQRLLRDAQEISGVEYNIDNLSDVYSAIHVIQGELDITGTTAKEAASTLSGSAQAMKSAFKNVLGKLTLGQDIQPALRGLVQTTTVFLVSNLLPAVWNIFRALPGGLITVIQTAAPLLLQHLKQLLPALQTMGPQLLQQGFQLLEWLIRGIITGLPQLTMMALQLVPTLVQGMAQQQPELLRTGGQLLTELLTGIAQKLPELLPMAAEVILQMVTGLLMNSPELLAAGFDLMVSLISGIGNAAPHILEAARGVAAKIWETVKNTDWIGLGKDIIRGMINGIGAMAGALWEAAKKIAHSVLDSIKSALGIASPSKVMRDQVGKWIPEGLALGITGNTAPVRRAMHWLAGLTTEPMRIPLLSVLRRPVPAGSPAGGWGHQIVFNQTIHTHDALTPAEMSREAEDLLERQKWGIP